MPTISSDAIPWIEKRSPSGKFHSFCRDISRALGGKANLGPRFGGHPFDVQIRRVPAGAAICPVHAHRATSEFFLVQSGTGIVRTGSFEGADRHHVAVKPGDFFFHPPGEAHQLTATGPEDLVVCIVADNVDLEATYYPDSKKWGLHPPGIYFDLIERDYLSGEDEPGASGTTSGAPVYRAPPARHVSVETPFAARLRNLADLPWDEYVSPKGKFRGASKELSVALGAKRNTPAGLGGHSFDVEYGRYDARQCGCPYHSHSAQTEFYLITEGIANLRTESGITQLRAGDAAICLPHEAHQLRNDSDAPMHYLCIADNPAADSWHYPDSGKYGFRQPRKIFRLTDADYWDGEE